ncbi:MAG TPA: NAD-dependent epimerase/dehydratase family protein [Longimicrobiales bacterium]|nr:NAD-dependent epimerase/dehydratase family protein [Longimicrobiales bacterium]
MKVLVTGATGYVGGAVCRALRADGREVLAGARSDQSTAALAAAGYETVRLDLSDPAGCARACAEADAVVHTAAVAGAERAARDRAAVETMLDALEGSGRSFIYTSGTWVLGDTGDSVATEKWPCRPLPMSAWQVEVEETVLAAPGRKIPTAVIRPATVHGAGGGSLAAFVDQIGKRGSVRVVGSGHQIWSTVHLDDVADLYARALRGIDAGGVFHAASGCAYPVRDLALAAATAAGGGAGVMNWPIEEARARLGEVADALGMTQRVEATRSRTVLGWVPRGPTAIEDLLAGSYRAS